ncbi:MAG: tetratricopeptide repeat protein [Gemmatimonadetes bacterium]|nr:MAG: tetratricopeptide repeat protein [Gemmatimonadota bacterium]
MRIFTLQTDVGHVILAVAPASGMERRRADFSLAQLLALYYFTHRRSDVARFPAFKPHPGSSSRGFIFLTRKLRLRYMKTVLPVTLMCWISLTLSGCANKALERGQYAYNSGDFETAIEEFSHLTSSEGLFYTACAYYRNGDDANALAYFEQAEAHIDPSKEEFWHALITPYKIRIYLNQADEYAEQGNYSEVLNLAKKAVALDPHHKDANRYLTAAYVELNMADEAKNQLERMTQTDSDNPQWYELLAEFYNRTHEYDKAVASYQKVMELRPNDAKIREKLAKAYLAQGNCEAAIPILKELIDLNPFSISTLFDLANCEQRQGDYQSAIAHYTAITNIAPMNGKAWQGIGASATWLEEYDQAITAYQKAIQSDPTDKISHYQLAHLYLHQNQLADALNAVSEAISIDNTYKEAYQLMGNIYRKMGDAEKAAEAFEKAESL